jgi:tetratricopeptide (TPR) repeat protein
MGDRAGIASTHSNLSDMTFEWSDPENAEKHINKSLEIYAELNSARNNKDWSTAFNIKANICRNNSNWGEARACLETALQLSEEIEDKIGQMDILNNMGRLNLEIYHSSKEAEAELAASTSEEYFRKYLSISYDCGEKEESWYRENGLKLDRKVWSHFPTTKEQGYPKWL